MFLRRLLIFITSFTLCFSILEWKNISLLCANVLHDMHYYGWMTSWLREYNTAQYLIWNKSYTWAKSLLAPLLNVPDIIAPVDVWEAYGDIVYTWGWWTGDVVVFYERALVYEDRPRIRSKIDFLRTHETINNKKEENQKTEPKQESSAYSGESIRESRREEIARETYDRNKSLDLQSSYANSKDIITRALETFQTWSVMIRDW